MNGAEETKVLSYKVGQVVNARSVRLEQRVTEPPERYTQPTLLDDMIGAYRFAKTAQDREMLKETGGLGTSRTRTPMIENLIRRGMFIAEKKGKRNYIISSPFLRDLVRRLPALMCDPALTAKWEVALGMIERGQATLEQVLEKERQFVTAMVDQAKTNAANNGQQGGTPSPGSTGTAPKKYAA
jgi:DNA topoisomerase-3